MSPLLVVAYAIAGTISIDFNSEPLGKWLPVYSTHIDAEWRDAMVFVHFRGFELRLH